MSTRYSVAWWNVENLFDEENAPRTDKLKRAIGKQLIGWTPALRYQKIAKIASVIQQLNGGHGPDLMGICEIENKAVIQALADRLNQTLPGRSYRVVHADTRDERGIDVAFIYEWKMLRAPLGERFQHVVMRRTATREIFQVNFTTVPKGRTWTVLGNHWPSRRGGASESAGYRMIAGETLSYFHQRAMEVHGPDTPVLAMGDFNDEPFDLSLVQHALSTGQRTKVAGTASVPRFWNLMWPLLGGGDGTFFFDNFAFGFDQFLVNKKMALADGPIRFVPGSVQIVRLPGMARTGDYPSPIPFGGMGKPVNPAGFSDHFPITMEVLEAD
ncbi:MAG: endonuclease/exonuclease/phosphatase [Chloroflexi bacterium]|nr:endonuclease/exonuclease/phosphatase [Chloroflexota bacterium]